MKNKTQHHLLVPASSTQTESASFLFFNQKPKILSSDGENEAQIKQNQDLNEAQKWKEGTNQTRLIDRVDPEPQQGGGVMQITEEGFWSWGAGGSWSYLIC